MSFFYPYILLNIPYEFLFISKLYERGKYDVGYPLNFYRDKFLRNLFVWNKQQNLKNIEIPLLEKIKQINFKKNLNALLPNSCHYLDSLLLYNTIEKIINLNIFIKTIHDSFYTNIKYKYSYIEIFKKD